jgi:hypothetical protein
VLSASLPYAQLDNSMRRFYCSTYFHTLPRVSSLRVKQGERWDVHVGWVLRGSQRYGLTICWHTRRIGQHFHNL